MVQNDAYFGGNSLYQATKHLNNNSEKRFLEGVGGGGGGARGAMSSARKNQCSEECWLNKVR